MTWVLQWLLGLFLVLAFFACIGAALNDQKPVRRGAIFLVPRP